MNSHSNNKHANHKHYTARRLLLSLTAFSLCGLFTTSVIAQASAAVNEPAMREITAPVTATEPTPYTTRDLAHELNAWAQLIERANTETTAAQQARKLTPIAHLIAERLQHDAPKIDTDITTKTAASINQITPNELALWAKLAYWQGQINERLARLHKESQPYGERAVQGYTLAAQYQHIPALNNLGVLYEQGMLTPQSIDKAYAFYRQAAQRDNAVAQYNLSQLILRHRPDGSNLMEAKKALEQSAKQGYAPAQTLLGKFLLYGEADYPIAQQEAIESLSAAADSGAPYAQYLLASALLRTSTSPTAQLIKQNTTQDMQRDVQLAATWLQQAADQRYAPAQLLLGKLYWFGLGVPSDNDKATTLWQAAAQQGLQEARDALNLMNGSQITTSQTNTPQTNASQAITKSSRSAKH
jgi:hypothetical protein